MNKNAAALILTHLVFNLTEVNENNPTIVLQATNEPGSFDKLETTLYGQEGFDQPQGEMIWCEVPEHIGRLYESHPDAIIGYLLMKIGETVGYDVPYGIERFTHPETKEKTLAIVPYETEQYNIPQLIPQGNSPRKFYATFGEALWAAEKLKVTKGYLALDISVWDIKGAIIGEYEYYYDEKGLRELPDEADSELE